MSNIEQKRLEHENWLRQNGVHPEQLAELRQKRKVVLVPIPDYSVEKALPLSDSIEKITYANEKDWQHAGELARRGATAKPAVADGALKVEKDVLNG